MMTVILVAKASAGETPFHNENGYPESPLSQVKGDAHHQFIGKMGTQAPYLGGPHFTLTPATVYTVWAGQPPR